jgi:D-arabinose 5-phosphate isomerase GutQ
MLLSPTVAARFVGAPGTLEGVTPLLVPDDVLVPIALVAVTVKVYV